MDSQSNVVPNKVVGEPCRSVPYYIILLEKFTIIPIPPSPWMSITYRTNSYFCLLFHQATERGVDIARRIPALTSYKSLASAGMIDVTYNDSIPWLQRQLQKLVKDYQIDSFYLDVGRCGKEPRFQGYRFKVVWLLDTTSSSVSSN